MKTFSSILSQRGKITGETLIVHRVKRTRDYCKKRGYKNVSDVPWAGTFPGTDLIKMQRSLNQGSQTFSGAH